MEDAPIHPPYKVLVVDDSAIVRGLVTRMMQDDPDIEVVGSVANGEDALGVMSQGGIEVVVLDIEMPVMDGLTALPKLLEMDPTVRVIMASTLTKRNADISFQAMTLGAVDYIPKPSSAKDLNVGEGFRTELLDKTKAWAEQRRKMLGDDIGHFDDAGTHADDHDHDHDHMVAADPDHGDGTPSAGAVANDASAPDAGMTAGMAATPGSNAAGESRSIATGAMPASAAGETAQDAPGHPAGQIEPQSQAQTPFRAELSAEHQTLHKPGRIQRKRFTAELRPRPMHQPGRMGAVAPISTRPTHSNIPQMPHNPAGNPTGQAGPHGTPDPHHGHGSDAGKPGMAAGSTHATGVNTGTSASPSRDPGGLIREAAIAAGAGKTATVPSGGANTIRPANPGNARVVAPAVAAARPARNDAAARAKAPAPAKVQNASASRAKAARAAAPAPARRALATGPVTLLAEKRINVEAIAIGSSTGGPQALFEVLRGLVGVRQPIFITQHMPATFTTILAEHISRLTGLVCQEGQTGMPIIGGQVYLAPGDYHMVIEGKGNSRRIVLNQNAPENFCRPSVDPMLRSLVESYGGNILTAILTGMGQDGMLGGRDVVAAGGMVVAQDEQTSVVWGMPGAAAHAGICSAVLPVGNIAAYIRKFAGGR